MNYKTFLEALSATNDIEEKEAIKKAFMSECEAVRTAIVDFIYDKVKNTDEFKNFINDLLERCENPSKKNVIESYLRHIYRNLSIRGRSKAKVKSMFKEFQNQIGLTDEFLLQSDVVGDKYVHINRDWGFIEVL